MRSMDAATLVEMGAELRAGRRARGITRAALARATGTRPVIVGRWERGEAVPSPAQARALAAVLDLPSAAATGWVSAAEQAAAEPGRGWRLPGRDAPILPAVPGGGASPRPGPAQIPASYLDDPGERRRYTLRWALTLLILGAMAVGLIWALGALADGWRALVDLFGDGPPAGGPAGALPLLHLV